MRYGKETALLYLISIKPLSFIYIYHVWFTTRHNNLWKAHMKLEYHLIQSVKAQFLTVCVPLCSCDTKLITKSYFTVRNKASGHLLHKGKSLNMMKKTLCLKHLHFYSFGWKSIIICLQATLKWIAIQGRNIPLCLMRWEKQTSFIIFTRWLRALPRVTGFGWD